MTVQPKSERLINDVNELLRTMPSLAEFHDSSNPDTNRWLGQAGAVLKAWNAGSNVSFEMSKTKLKSRTHASTGYDEILTLLHEASHDILMRLPQEQRDASIAAGKVFEYFDELRQRLEMATHDVLFVDPYLDADFVSRYLPYVKKTTKVRLLTSKYIDKLVPAAAMFSKESGLVIELRKASERLHDRFVFIDSKRGFQSGASFKDGAKNASTTLIEIVDVLEPVLQKYEEIWAASVSP